MTSRRPTYIDLDCDRFLARTARLSAAEGFACLALDATAWCEPDPCTLPNDDAELAAIAKATVDDWAKMKSRVLREWSPKGDRLVNETLLAKYNKSLKRMEKNRENGKKGGRPKEEPEELPEENNPTVNPNETDGLAKTNPTVSDRDSFQQPKAKAYEIGDLRPETGDLKSETGDKPPPPARGPSLSGQELTAEQQTASDRIFAAAQCRMRPPGPAGDDWFFGLNEATWVSSAIDSMLTAKPALIDGKLRYASEFVPEISAVIAASTPVSTKSLCSFIGTIWSRCQRDGCVPGAKHKSASLAVEHTKPKPKTVWDELEKESA